MIMLEGMMNSSVLHFPAEYSVALPDSILDGKNPPVILLLHGLGCSDEQWKYGVRLERLAERFGAAFVMPSSRRSCFQDMAHGPAWNTWLKSELLPAIKTQTGAGGGKTATIGVGTGALGVYALAMTDPSVIGAAIDPVEGTPFERDEKVWPSAGEWDGVFDGAGSVWEKGLPDDSRGLVLAAPDCPRRIRAEGWQVRTEAAQELEALLEKAVEYCMARLSE